MGYFLLHWRYELPCQDKLPEFHYTPILGCIRVLWLVSHPLGLGLDKALGGWNSVTGAKELDSWLPHHFSAAGVPTNTDECLEAVQSDLTGHNACFLLGLWDM